jgi:protein-disulfide isomerase
MKNQYFVLVAIAIVAMLLGSGLTVKISRDPLLREFVGLQKEILANQRQVVENLSSNSNQIKSLSARFEQMETKVTDLSKNSGRPADLPPMPPPENFTKVHTIPTEGALILGQADAPVTISGFLDLQCPFSARFQPVIDQVLAAYPGQVRFVVKNFPLSFHPQAKPAAKALLAAGAQGKGQEMLDLILKNAQDLSDEKYLELAQELKLNKKKFSADLKEQDGAWNKVIEADLKLGQTVDVRGTPTYYLNGRKTVARTFEDFKEEIDAVLNNQ